MISVFVSISVTVVNVPSRRPWAASSISERTGFRYSWSLVVVTLALVVLVGLAGWLFGSSLLASRKSCSAS